jgi:hypothetical protein
LFLVRSLPQGVTTVQSNARRLGEGLHSASVLEALAGGQQLGLAGTYARFQDISGCALFPVLKVLACLKECCFGSFDRAGQCIDLGQQRVLSGLHLGEPACQSLVCEHHIALSQGDLAFQNG